MRGARQLGEHSIDQILAGLNRFEDYTRRKAFAEFRIEQASGFKKHLASLNAAAGNRRLSKATLTSTLYAMRDFIIWLSEQKGFRNRLVRTDADYFKPSRRDEAIARAPRPKLVPSVEQVKTMLLAMPDATPVNRRDRALVALIMLTGARDDAVASARLKHLDLVDRQLFQDAREMRTKFRKTFPTWFLPVGDEFLDVINQWKHELETLHEFGPDDPLFPKTEVTFGAGGVVLPPRLKRECWANADPIRAVFKRACAQAGLRDFKPHSLRHTLAQLADEYCTTPGEYKSWSQNLGHSDVLVTLTSYGTVPSYKQREIILKMTKRPKDATFA